MARASPAPLEPALAALQRGDHAEARRLCGAILAAHPRHFHALYVMGVAAGQAGKPQQAVEFLSRALALDATQADVHFNLGVALGELGRQDEALDRYASVLALDPARADAHFNRAVALAALGRHGEALQACDRAIALQPGGARAHHARGLALSALQRPAEALESFERAVGLEPGLATAHNGAGATLACLGRPVEALARYERAIALRPGYVEALVNRAIALVALDRPGEALESCEQALALRPGYVDAHYNRGNALRDLGRYPQAAESFERAIALQPDHAPAHWNLADCRLLLGDFERGWAEYEWRGKLASREGERRRFAQPPWLGEEPLAGRTILLHAELGLGDTLQFCRYASEVAARGARVVLEVQAPLVALVATLEGVAQVVARGDALPEFDLHCPLMSLPLAFRSRADSIPARIPYLRSDPARLARWRGLLGNGDKPRIGLAWSGSQGLRGDRRSMALAQALAFVGDSAQWVSLQKEVREADAALLRSRPEILPLGEELADFADTAALVEALDLVVTVDTSVAHVAGALGKPVWILLPHVPHDWRWLLEREDSPWYPGARLLRQPAPGDWASVVARVGRDLERRSWNARMSTVT